MNKTFGRPAFYLFKKVWALILVFFIFQHASGQGQDVLLMVDTFANVNDITFDAPGVGSNTGTNDWIINANYNGQPTYPNTQSEDSLVSGLGQIAGAPYSTYLHIHDATEPGGVSNANWNPARASDRFCYFANTMCTSGLSNVKFTFFWTGQGDSTAYGRVYYSTNGGVTWTQANTTKYYNQPDWAYEAITNPAFDNQPNIQFGFRWVNAGSDTTKDVSWGIADVIAVGTYNSQTNGAANFHIISVTPDTVCEQGTITVTFSLNPPLCFGAYIAFLSKGNGSFVGDSILNPVFYLDQTSTVWQTQLTMPDNEVGTCFRLFLQREAGTPTMQIQSDTSACITMIQCPVTVVTNNAPVMNDADTTCLKSAIDVYFNSFGNLNLNNVYYAELSDSTGSFAHPDTIGHLTSDQQFPTKPGDVSGLIPANVPPGCGYKIRVVSSSPSAIGTIIGPFCLTECDVTTNNTQDLQVCINYPYPTDTLSLTISPNQWNQGASYDTCNNWTIELLDMTTFAVVNIGGIGVYHDSVGGVFKLIVGPLSQLPVAPGTYYMRIISNCSNETWNETGTVIRITIGAPAVGPSVSIYGEQSDSIYCYTSEIVLCVTPYNSNSNYVWNSNLLATNPTETTYPCIGVAPNVYNLGDWVFYVKEENFGCFGPGSSPYPLVITALPTVQIGGPKKVCLGDTAIFDATYFPATYYNWTSPPGSKVVVNSNTQVSIVFDSIGTFIIHENSINICGGGNGQDTIQVQQLFDVSAKPDKTVCFGDSVTLEGIVPPYPKTFLSLDSVTQSTGPTAGGMFNIHTYSDIIIDSFAVLCHSTGGNIGPVSVYTRPGGYHGFEQSPGSWAGVLINYTIPLASHPATQTVIPVELNKHIAAGDTVAFYITSTSSTLNLAYGNGRGIQQGVVYKSDGVIDFIQGTENLYPFGTPNGPKVLDVTIYYRTLSGLHYLWSNGATTDTISFVPTQSGQYNIKVFDTTGCHNADTVLVTVDTVPHVYAGPDTIICPNSNYIMPATASASAILSWSPSIGLSQASALNPALNITQTTGFVLTATGEGGCAKSDSVLISIHPLSVNAGPDTTLCADETYVMQGLASTDSFEWFPSTGLSAVNILNPVFNYTQTNQYYLSVQDAEGCTLTDTVLITVEYCDVYIKAPDAFTPNGDGVNDFFTVFGKYISDYHIRIYNRWGEEVYSSSNVNELNDLSRGWDGTYKGKLQDIGTFVYYIEAKDLNGHNVFRKGNVTLIR